MSVSENGRQYKISVEDCNLVLTDQQDNVKTVFENKLANQLNLEERAAIAGMFGSNENVVGFAEGNNQSVTRVMNELNNENNNNNTHNNHFDFNNNDNFDSEINQNNIVNDNNFISNNNNANNNPFYIRSASDNNSGQDNFNNIFNLENGNNNSQYNNNNFDTNNVENGQDDTNNNFDADNIDANADILYNQITAAYNQTNGFNEHRHFRVQTQSYGRLTFNVERATDGDRICILNVANGENLTPEMVMHANMVNQTCVDKLNAEFNHKGFYRGDQVFCDAQSIIDNHDFQNLEAVIRTTPDLEEGFDDGTNTIGRDNTMHRMLNLEAVTNQLTEGGLKDHLQEMLSKGYRLLIVTGGGDGPVRFDIVNPKTGMYLDVYDVMGYDLNRLKTPPEPEIPVRPEIQYVVEPQIEYVEQPQIEYVEQPQIEYVEEPQVVQYVDRQIHQEPVVGGESGNAYFTQPQRLKRIGGTMQGITNTPFVPVQKIQRHYYQRQPMQQQQIQQSPQEGVAKPIPITSTITIEEEKPEEIDITVGKAPKKVVKKKKRKTAKSEKSGDFYNIRTDIKESGGVAAQAGQPGAPVAPVSTNPQVANTTSPQSPLVIVTDTQKKEQLKTDDNVKVILDHTPVNAKDDIKMTIDHKDIVDELKVLIEQKGQEQAKTMKDIVDNIKVTIENNQDVPKEQLQLYDKILIEIDKMAQKTPEISFDFNNDDVLKEIDSLKEKIDNLKRDNIVVRDDISIDLNQLEEVNGRLASIESRLDAMKTPSGAAKSIDELKIEIQDLKEKYPEFVVDYPDVQQITDKLSLLIEEKFKDLKINDKIEVNQQVPEISIDFPQFNVNDRIEVQNGEKPRDMIVNDKVDIKNPDIVIEQPDIVVEQQDLSGITNSIEELKKTFGNFKDEIKIQIEQKLKDINVNDKIEVNQQVPEISIDFPNFNVNGKTEVNQNAPAKKEDNETVITNEYIENGTKAEDTEIVNEYEEKREPIVQGSAPSPMPGFIPHQMMMPPVFMPPPMPMPVAGLAAQQPIVITQNQSDEEKGNSFWSNFWKVLLILLLIASIIGLGLLMWKNMQKNTEQKQEPKPDQPEPKPEPQPQKQEEIKITPNDTVNPGPVKTSEGQTVQPVCKDGQNLQLNVNADKVNLGTDVGQLTTDAKSAINLENVGTHNKLIGENGNTIDTSHIIIDNNKIQVREWGDITKNPKVYEGTIQNGKAVINGQTYTIANENGNAYSSGSIDLAKQTSYTRNSDGTLSTNFGDLKSDMQINKNNTFTLNTKTENGTVVSTNTVDDISNNATMQDILKNKLNDSSLTKGEYNRIMDALDNGKLDDSYFQTINNNKTGLSLDNGNGVGNSTGV